MNALLCALLGGVTIVLSRSVNGYLSLHSDAYQSTFFNYFTGFITSFVLMLLIGVPYFSNADIIQSFHHPLMFIGGVIGVFNVLILNIIVSKVSPIKLTLITFISQLMSGILLDYCFYGLFTLNKLIGCLIVMVGLIIYQFADQKQIATSELTQ